MIQAAKMFKAATALRATGGTGHVVPFWSAVMLVAAIAMALGPEIAEMNAWGVAKTPAWIGHNIHLVASVLTGWASQFIVKK